MKQLIVGILAHVDAGKTTLSEGMLYAGGSLQKLGRVDHGDAFLDTDHLERERGITIFSKQAQLQLPECNITLMDTPGHVDFSAEAERVLQVLDYAILVISGSDGVQGHTETLWRLLQRYHVPTFIFVNKIDLPGADRAQLLRQLKQRLSPGCTDFSPQQEPESFWENVSLCSEELMERYLQEGSLIREDIAAFIARRRVFPCYFGSALKMQGVQDFLSGLCAYTRAPEYSHSFGARVFKIVRDAQGQRLTYLKVTGGCLHVKDVLRGGRDEPWEEKADQLRLYSGAKFSLLEQAPAGTVCAVTGLTHTFAGQGLGSEEDGAPAALEPVLTYRVQFAPDCDALAMLPALRQLEEEDPQLHIVWNETLREVHIQLMGDVQLEILRRRIAERFGTEVTFGAGNIVYRETITDTVEGIGHFEPLRHYAEVHLLLQPGERGSGLVVDSVCSEDILDRNWQRLILTHLEEKQFLGVLTGAPITDLHITLLTGRAHLKHTEGGDFRQATYRAVRQGLMQATSLLLEPWYSYRLELPTESVGRAMADLQRMGADFSAPETRDERSILSGHAPVSTMRDYAREVTAYTHGLGRLTCTPCGCHPCHNADEVIATAGYDPERDTDNTPDSVFCAHGAGYTVKWDEVARHAHVNSGLPRAEAPDHAALQRSPARTVYPGSLEEDKELQAIFEREFGPVRGRSAFEPVRRVRPSEPQPAEPVREYLLVDGYNIIFSWDELKELARTSLDTARTALIDILCNYQGYRKNDLILVFDAYKVKGSPGTVETHGGIHVVYTREAETADMYIEKTTYEIAPRHRVRVATSDGAEQMIILGHGAARLSARAFHQEVNEMNRQIREFCRPEP